MFLFTIVLVYIDFERISKEKDVRYASFLTKLKELIKTDNEKQVDVQGNLRTKVP